MDPGVLKLLGDVWLSRPFPSDIWFLGAHSPISVEHEVAHSNPADYLAPPSTDYPHHPGDTEDLRFCPMSTHGVRRHDRYQDIGTSIKPDEANFTIDALTVEYPSSDRDIPEGWSIHVHPEGAEYFLCESTRTYTEVDICDPEILHDIQGFSNTLHESLRLFVIEKDLNVELNKIELVLEPTEDEFGTICCYYFINHRARCLFWLQDYDAEIILTGTKGLTSLSHKRFAIEAEYWWAQIRFRKHWDHFPNFCRLTQNVKDEIREMMLHGICDHLAPKRTSAPFSVDELKNYIFAVDAIKASVDGALVDRSHSVGIIDRHKYLNYHSGKGGRFDPTHYGRSYTKSKRMMTVDALLFGAPTAQLKFLHNNFVNAVASFTAWRTFTAKLNNELQDFNLLATVLLGANVGFLSIQSVDDGDGRSLTQVASYLSLVASMGSVLVGFIVRHNRTSQSDTAHEAITLLESMYDDKHGLESLAILYSLPYALLMWGMLFFAVGFCIECFKPGDTISRVLVGLMVFTVCALIAWCSYVAAYGRQFWKNQKDELPPLAGQPLTFGEPTPPPEGVDSALHTEVHTIADAGFLRGEESTSRRVSQDIV
ncbi:hypothetical protein BJ138DRAFT_1102917 [Hygrophoropsis aurantiaca]|uniref:Uncharacterized protein n=1 Tax=Hygrophoropsis aurantiaca TaxID=72124 RepID=A0ACB8A902_9AGAM|nr:hypothetical protein BJ138DRAFT_1102917 [Hygrophoropsis aurantiaca]